MIYFKRLLSVLLLLNLKLSECRHLVAAPKGQHLKRSVFSFEPRYDGNSVMYADRAKGYSQDISSVFAAEVKLQPKLPMLVFDEIEDRVNSITCSMSEIRIHFHNKQLSQQANETWSRYPEFLMIFMNIACADAGIHQPHVVSLNELDSISGDLVLSSRPVSMHECTHKMHVELGGHVGQRLSEYVVKRHDTDLIPRQETPTSISSKGPQIASGVPTMSFPSTTITQSSLGASATASISFSEINKQIIPPDNAIATSLLNANFPLLENVVLTCVECSASGHLELVAGGFDVEDNGPFDDFKDAKNFLTKGYLKFASKDVRANASLELSLKPGASISTEVITGLLPPVPITPIAIADLLTLGPTFQPTFPLTVSLNSEVDIVTGLTLEVPDSEIVLNVSHPGDSHTSGFDKAKVTPIQPNVNAPNLSFELSAAFKPLLGLTAQVGSKTGVEAEGGIGFFLDLPKLLVNFTHLDSGNAKCEPLSGPGEIYQNLEKVDSSVVLDVGYYANAEVDFAGEPFFKTATGKPFISTSYPLPAKCLRFDPEKSGLVEPSATTSGKNGPGETKGEKGVATANAGSMSSLLTIFAFHLVMAGIGGGLLL